MAQLAIAGTIGAGFYQDAPSELTRLLAATEVVAPVFLAKTALHVRTKGHMQDMPAVLLEVQARREPSLFAVVFDRIVDQGKMRRTIVQIVRSGQTGRNSLGSRPKAMVQVSLNRASDEALLAASVGNDPSLADVVRMVHPKPETAARAAFQAWLIGKPADMTAMPQAV